MSIFNLAGARAGDVPRGRPSRREANTSSQGAGKVHQDIGAPRRHAERLDGGSLAVLRELGYSQARHASTAAGCEAKWGMTSCAKRSIMRRVSVWL